MLHTYRRFCGAFLVCLLFCVNMMAQNGKFSVSGFASDPFDLSARSTEYEKIDANGSRYAIIKVTSNNPDDKLGEYDFNFGNMNHRKEIRDGVIWLYVQKNARRVTISRKNYQSVVYDFDTNIEAGANYTMMLSVSGTVVYTQMVEFDVRPLDVGAVVMVKGTGQNAAEEFFGQADETGSVAKNLPLGTYTYRIFDRENIYKVSEGRITLKDRTQTYKEEVTLSPAFSTMTLVAVEGAEILINGESKGKDSWTGRLKAGSYHVETRLAKHKSTSQYITVGEDDDQTIQLESPAPIMGTMAVTSSPSGALIKIDGKEYGQTPRNIDLIIGNHTIALSKPNYKPDSMVVEIEEDKTVQANLKLSDIAHMTIKSHPEGASLKIDGRMVGVTPYSEDMPSGDYDLQLSAKKYRSFHQMVHLDSSNPQTEISLKRQYVSKSSFYLQPTFQIGSSMAAGGTMGCYISNVNIEVGYLMGLDKSEEIYWNSNNTLSSSKPFSYTYSASFVDGRIGYGVILGSYFRVTPQVGVTVASIKGKGDKGYSKASASKFSVGCKIDYAFGRHFTLFLTPEWGTSIMQGDNYRALSGVSSTIKGWTNGFNLRMGLSLFFD